MAGRRLADPGLRRVGLEVLDWLIAIQTTRHGMFTPVGNDGWWPHGGARSRFDQQPIEATALILAAGAAYDVTADVALPAGRGIRLRLVPGRQRGRPGGRGRGDGRLS